MNMAGSPVFAIDHALGRLRDIVTELNDLHLALINGSRIDTPGFDTNPRLSFDRVSVLRAWLKLKSDRAAVVFILLTRTPGGLVTFETILSGLGIDVQNRGAISAKNRKLVHVYMCDLRHGLADAGYQGVIQSRPTLGYVLSAPAARSILKAFGTDAF
jgi:hypothetical protein